MVTSRQINSKSINSECWSSNCLVHPCDKEDKAGCAHECERDGALFKCICKEGFTLDNDGKKCNKGTI